MSEFGRYSSFDPNSKDWHSWQLMELSGRERKQASPVQPTSSQSNKTERKSAQPNKFADRAEVKQKIQEDFEKAKEAGFQEGLEEGRKKGFVSGYEGGSKKAADRSKAQISESLASIKEMTKAYSEAMQGLSDNVSNKLVDLAIDIGRKLAMDTISEDPDVIKRVVSNLLNDETLFSHTVSIYLNPKDIPLIKNHLAMDLEGLEWRLLADESISRGGCLLKSDGVNIDATLETRWNTIRARTRVERNDLDSNTAEAPTEGMS